MVPLDWSLVKEASASALIVQNPHLAMTGEALIGALSEYSPRWLQSSCGKWMV
jgi:hypothetical protein